MVGCLSCFPSLRLAICAIYFIFGVLWVSQDTPLPGPPEYPIVSNAIQVQMWLPTLLDALMHCSHEFEWKTWTFKVPLMPRFVIITDPRCVESVLKLKFDNYVKGPIFHNILVDLLGDGIFNSDGKHWLEQRKTASHMFSTRMLSNVMLPVFSKHADVVCDMLDGCAKAGTELDMQDVYFRYTLDSIAEIGFGTTIGSLEDPEHPFARAFDGAQWHAEKRFFFPLWPVVEPFTTGGWQYRRSIKVLNDYCYDLIRERRASGSFKTGEDVLSRFMRLPGHDDDRYLRDVVLNFLIAGRDTTAQALSWATHMLTQHPEVEERMLAELAERSPGSGCPDYATANSLKYTQAVVKETLRLWPSVPKDVKQAVHADTLPDGTHIKAGWFVVYVPFAMGRDKRLWGEDAAEFRPQRFVDDPNPSPYKYPVFNAGDRQCLGKNMAVLEATAALATIYKRFSLKLVPGQDIRPENSLTMPMRSGIRVIPVARDPPMATVAASATGRATA